MTTSAQSINLHLSNLSLNGIVFNWEATERVACGYFVRACLVISGRSFSICVPTNLPWNILVHERNNINQCYSLSYRTGKNWATRIGIDYPHESSNTMATENGLLCNAPDGAYHRLILQRDESLVSRTRFGVGNCNIPSLLSWVAFVQEGK